MKVVSFYHFIDLADPQSVRDRLQALCDELGLLGTILVASEGFNGTVAGDAAQVMRLFEWLKAETKLESELDARWTDATTAPFRRMRVKVKKEIVTLGRPDILPQKKTGKHVAPQGWNELLDDPDVLLIDTRNHYEVEVGTFPGALDPGNDSFREFPEFAAELAETSRDRPLAMFCTGGIRCEKATALMLELGFDTVYQLQGGILNYLEQMPAGENRWQGECFVFDTRVAVDRDLSEGGYVQCHACRRPLSVDDMRSPDYHEGVSCPKCVNEADEERRARLEERRRQVELAERRGEAHIGPKTGQGWQEN
ncbi:MAG: rhodanese-related sulfurtransferase [Gammaproteobacteria bacterium]|nr:rhodanese-related sulfurtransferase [Gammaproteobacteria bacterium]